MKAFGRRVEFQIKDKLIDFPRFEIEFETEFSETSEGNVGHIRFFNLSDKTIRLFKKDEKFTLKAGYKEDIGNILPGVIESSSTRWENFDKITEIIVGDATDSWLKATVNNTWKSGIKAERIAADLIDKLPLDKGEINLSSSVTYSKGKTFSCKIKKALEEIAKDTESKLHIARGQVYLRPPQGGQREVVLLNKETGLIGSPNKIEAEEDKEAYKIQSLLNHRIYTDEILEIESKTINGLYRAQNGKHLKSGNDFITEAEVVEYNG